MTGAFHSLRNRLVALTAALLTLVTVSLGLLSVRLRERELNSSANEFLAQRLALLVTESGPPPMPDDRGPADRNRDPGAQRNRTPEQGNRKPSSPSGNSTQNGTSTTDDANRRGPPPPPMEMGDDAFNPFVEGNRPPDWNNADNRRPQRPVMQRSLSKSTILLFNAEDPRNPYFCIWSSSGSVVQKSANCPETLAMPAAGAEAAATAAGSALQRTQGQRREAYMRTVFSSCILVGVDLTEPLAAQRRFTWSLLAGGVVVLLTGTSLCALLVSKMLRPVAAISRTAHAMATGELSARVPECGGDGELDRLARELNRSFAALEDAFHRQRGFTADASHELRTPLAVIISETQATLARPRDSQEYREALENCLQSAQQMRSLIDAMLELARIDAVPNDPSRLKPVALDGIAETCLNRLCPQVAAAGLGLIADLHPTLGLGDEQRIQQVITNLLTNAIAYNRNGGEVRVACRAAGDWAELSVADTGIGISQEDLPRIFDRFWRADKARGRAQGHHGLGLSICRAITLSQNGTLEVWSKPGIGTCFTLRLPLSQGPGSTGSADAATPPSSTA